MEMSIKKERKLQIVSFAEKWIAAFSDQTKKGIELSASQDFMNDCFALKFEMDCGKGFFEKYQIDSFDDVIKVLPSVDDIDYLASVIFSNWRYFNHWAYDSSEILEYRDWFITTLTKLKELAS